MRRWILQCLAFVLLQAGIGTWLLRGYRVEETDNYLAETVAKNRRLRAAGPGKVVLVGGSALAFGIDSARLESELGRPVVNMGLAAGLGAEYLLAEVEPALGPGDVVVLSLEYDHFARGPQTGWRAGPGFEPALLEQVLLFRPAGIRHLGRVHLGPLVLDRGLPLAGAILRRAVISRWERWGGSSPPDPRPVHGRGFNAWGDHLLPDEVTAQGPAADGEGLSRQLVGDARGFPSAVLCRRLAAFVEAMAARGVQVAWSFAPKPAGVIAAHDDLAVALEAALKAIPGLVLLDRPGEQEYPPERFFGSANHLDRAGAIERTERLRRRLEEALRGGGG